MASSLRRLSFTSTPRETVTESKSVLQWRCGVASETGKRRTNEDTHFLGAISLKSSVRKKLGRGTAFFAVYDGHGGDAAARYLKGNLHKFVIAELNASSELKMPASRNDDVNDQVIIAALRTAFQKADTELCASSQGESGSTAATLLIVGERLYSAWAGDSRSVSFSLTYAA